MSWNELHVLEKLKLIDKTVFLIIAGNLLSMFGTIFYTMSPAFTVYTAQLFCGYGCFLTWITVTRYLRNSESYALVNRTINFSISMVMQVAIGVLPFIIGYIFLGMSLFYSA